MDWLSKLQFVVNNNLPFLLIIGLELYPLISVRFGWIIEKHKWILSPAGIIVVKNVERASLKNMKMWNDLTKLDSLFLQSV
jgi:hypothetical protein